MREESIRSALAAHGRLAVDVSTLSNDDDLYAAGLTSHATINVMLALEDDLEIEFPNVRRWFDVMKERPAVHKAIEEGRKIAEVARQVSDEERRANLFGKRQWDRGKSAAS